jgi:hypothetical protein
MTPGDECKRQDRKLSLVRSLPIAEPFRISSKRPAIGATFAPNIATSLSPVLSRDLPPGQSAPHVNTVRIGGKKYPFDETMRKHIKSRLLEDGVPQEVIDTAWASTPWSPSGEEAENARKQDKIAVGKRHSRNKL